MASDSSGRSRVARATRDLMVAWGDTRARWRDARAAGFEERFLDGLPEAATAATRAMEDLENLLRRIRQDCE